MAPDQLDATTPLKNQRQVSKMSSEELSEAENTVMFIFSSMKIALDMRHNQVGGLLANQHRFLI